MSILLTENGESLRDGFMSLRQPEDIARLLDIEYRQLIYYLYRLDIVSQYTTFTVNKKSGGTRVISTPISPLKIIQGKLNQVLQSVYQPKQAVHGFVPVRSVVTNARAHKGRNHVLTIDLNDFFPSINFGRVRGMFMAIPYGLPPDVATVLAQICCWNNSLPQGAPTSPVVSNMICSKMDSQLQRLAKQFSCTYTRYADDISLSTKLKNFPTPLATRSDDIVVIGNALIEVIESNGFTVNVNKVRLKSKGFRQSVTGLIVNKRPNVRRTYIRQIRGMLHAWERYGLGAAQEWFDQRDTSQRSPFKPRPSFRTVVQGKIAYVGMVKGLRDKVYINLYSRFVKLDQGVDFKPDIDNGKRRMRIFLSYAREDEEVVAQLYERLTLAGHQPWMDKPDIVPGQIWKTAIERAISDCDLFIACLSTTAVAKRGNVQKEFRAALEIAEGKFDDDVYIIPLKIEACEVPSQLQGLRDRQWLEYYETNGWQQLERAIRIAEEKLAIL